MNLISEDRVVLQTKPLHLLTTGTPGTDENNSSRILASGQVWEVNEDHLFTIRVPSGSSPKVVDGSKVAFVQVKESSGGLMAAMNWNNSYHPNDEIQMRLVSAILEDELFVIKRLNGPGPIIAGDSVFFMRLDVVDNTWKMWNCKDTIGNVKLIPTSTGVGRDETFTICKAV